MSNANDFVIENGELNKYTGKDTEVVIPDYVTSIGWCAFYGCTSITSITIPDSVTSIGGHAFSGCTCLTSINIPDNVTSIKGCVFSDCTSLTSITIPDSVTSIGECAFEGCTALRISIPESVTSIGKYAFAGCDNVIFHISDETANIPENFVIENNILKDYKGLGGNVTIQKGITHIGYCAFHGCTCLTSIVVPENVTNIGYEAFEGCTSLKSIILPDSVASIEYGAFKGCTSLEVIEFGKSTVKLNNNVFGDTFPSGLTDKIATLYPRMGDGALKQYVLKKETWETLDPSLQTEIFLSRQGKPLTIAYSGCINTEQLIPLGKAVINFIKTAKPSAKECAVAVTYMSLFYEIAPIDILKSIYSELNQIKAGSKAVKTIEENTSLMKKLNSTSESDKVLPEEQRISELLKSEGLMPSNLESLIKDFYSLTYNNFAKIQNKIGNEEAPFVLAWMLTAHEKKQELNGGQPDIISEYSNPGLCPEAAEIVAFLDQASLQSALLKLADENLGFSGRSKKMFLAYPICRYADEELMTELTKRAPTWRSSVSGNDAPPLLTFRQAAMYSNTRAAMLFAERYHELDDYAKVRGMDEDTFRDKYLSDVGLDEQGGKTYDLGNQTVTARLQKDMSFLVELPNGKTAKSLPKKGADAEKYEAAKKDFAEMKKSVKKILKNRGKVLFEDFLSGKKRSAEDWQGSYLHNPLLREAASLVVWAQGKNTFTLKDGAPVNSAEQPYTITDKPIRVAHPMEMKEADIKAWQKYFTSHGLKQPFAQVWEPVRKAEEIKEDRYKDCMIPYYRFLNQEKHGITVEDNDFHNEIYINLDECDTDIERIDWNRHEINPEDRFEVHTFKFKKYSRQVNHIVAYLDRVTVWDRVRKDDLSVMDMIDGFTLAQITDFIAAAQEANAVNVLAALLEYKNNNFADFDPMDEFTLEW